MAHFADKMQSCKLMVRTGFLRNLLELGPSSQSPEIDPKPHGFLQFIGFFSTSFIVQTKLFQVIYSILLYFLSLKEHECNQIPYFKP